MEIYENSEHGKEVWPLSLPSGATLWTWPWKRCTHSCCTSQLRPPDRDPWRNLKVDCMLDDIIKCILSSLAPVMLMWLCGRMHYSCEMKYSSAEISWWHPDVWRPLSRVCARTEERWVRGESDRKCTKRLIVDEINGWGVYWCSLMKLFIGLLCWLDRFPKKN